MIITINMPLFEVWSHEIEYVDELLLATVDIIILALAVALAQFCIFNFSGWEDGGFPTGEPIGEKRSHDLEFVFGCISSFITFWFAMDNALEADQKTKALYRGDLGKLGLEDM